MWQLLCFSFPSVIFFFTAKLNKGWIHPPEFAVPGTFSSKQTIHFWQNVKCWCLFNSICLLLQKCQRKPAVNASYGCASSPEVSQKLLLFNMQCSLWCPFQKWHWRWWFNHMQTEYFPGLTQLRATEWAVSCCHLLSLSLCFFCRRCMLLSSIKCRSLYYSLFFLALSILPLNSFFL